MAIERNTEKKTRGRAKAEDAGAAAARLTGSNGQKLPSPQPRVMPRTLIS